MMNKEDEKIYIRKLATAVAALARDEHMEELTQQWRRHNAGELTRPLIYMEMFTFEKELLPPLQCADPLHREAELYLQRQLTHFYKIGDDKVVSAEFEVTRSIDFCLFQLREKRITAEDAGGNTLGFAREYPLTDLTLQLSQLHSSYRNCDKAADLGRLEYFQELLGDILTVRYENTSLYWAFGLTYHIVALMGMEGMFVASLTEPEAFAVLLERVTEELRNFLLWQQDEGLLTLNNGNNYAGSGSFGFSDELPAADFSGKVRSQDLWGNLNSQETVGVSPEQFMTQYYPFYEKLAAHFGLTYYGCCEPIHDLWDAGLKNLPHLRKVSVSPWCDVRKMGCFLRGGKIVLARKISPNFIGVDPFSPAELQASVTETLQAADGCPLEFSYRDIYTLCREPERAKRAVEITRNCIRDFYQ